MLTREDFQWMYDRLGQLTPLRADCGELCSSICCTGLEAHAGMYLFPGEEVMYSAEESWCSIEWHAVSEREFAPAWDGIVERIAFLVCDGTCPRESRPLACRLFPLAAVVEPRSDGGVNVDVQLDVDAAFICPLARYARKDQLDVSFVEAAKEVYERLCADPVILADLLWQSQRRALDLSSPWAKLLR